jgi:hypothetical protein
MSSKTPPALQDGGHDEEAQTPDWEDIARKEFAFRIQDRGEELRDEFYKTAAVLMDGGDIEGEDLEALRSELRHSRTFVEENITEAASYTPGSAVQRLRALEWQMLQFYQLIASEISRSDITERQIEHRLEEHHAMGEQLEELLHDVQEDDDE